MMYIPPSLSSFTKIVYTGGVNDDMEGVHTSCARGPARGGARIMRVHARTRTRAHHARGIAKNMRIIQLER